MKKKIAKFLVWVSKRITPTSEIYEFEKVHKYEPKICARAYVIDKSYVKKLRKAEHIKSSREAMKIAENRELSRAKRDVLETIEKHLMEQRTYAKGKSKVIEVRVNCYVPKEL